jgi:hypothetical protein
MVFGLSSVVSFQFTNILVVLITLTIYVLVAIKLTNKIFGLLTGVLFFLLSTNMTIYEFALSEALFALLLLSFFGLLLTRKRYSKSKYLLLGLLAGLTALTRNSGISVVIFGVLYVLTYELLSKKADLKGILVKLKWYVIGLAPLLLWYFRNIFINGNIFGVSMPRKSESVINIFIELLLTINVWWIGSLIGILILIVYLYNRGDKDGEKSNEKKLAKLKLLGTCLFCIGYLMIMAYSIANYCIDPIQTRYIEPLYTILLLLFSISLYLLMNRFVKINRIGYLALILAITVLGVNSKVLSPNLDEPIISREYGAAAMRWIRSSTNPDSLFIGSGVWNVRFATGRSVLESGYPHMPSLYPDGVRDFIKSNDRFSEYYYVAGYSPPVPESLLSCSIPQFNEENLLEDYDKVDIDLNLVFSNDSVEIYQMTIN